ncbi:MAG: preprotein translocase subunit YajC [Lachnospiraceae bacterium]|nr:preprotein translocase subunit YajC [Lachnospiraceae bacterium]
MNGILLTANEAAASGAGSLILMVLWIAIIIGFMYFFMIRPQKKEQKKLQEMISSMEVGDYVLTTSGFYGSIIDITDDTVIVEFGNNKNCRIPMQKNAISQIEKATKE